MTDENQAAMSDAELEAALLAEEATEQDAEPAEQETATETEGEPADEADAEPPADQQEQEAEQQSEQEQTTDDAGPGDLKVALKQAREEQKALKQQLAEVNAWRQQQEQQRMQAQYQADEQARIAQRTQMLEDAQYDPERTQQLLAHFAREDAHFANQQANQALTQARYQDGVTMAREAFSDFDTVMGRAMADQEQAAILEAVGNQALAQGKNPVIAAYQMAKRLDPDANKALIEAEVAKQVKAVLQKNQPPQSKGHQTIGHASGSAPSVPQMKAAEDMSDAELEAMLR